MANKKTKAAGRKRKATKKRLAKKSNAVLSEVIKIRWIGWMRESEYDRLKVLLSEDNLRRIRTSVQTERIIFQGRGTEVCVRVVLYSLNSHVKLLNKFVKETLLAGVYHGGRFKNMETRRRCPLNCSLSSASLFLVGCLSPSEYRAFENDITVSSGLSWSAEVAYYLLGQEGLTVVEIYCWLEESSIVHLRYIFSPLPT